jgi:hypothetical protein
VDGEEGAPFFVGQSNQGLQRRGRPAVGGDLLALALQQWSDPPDVVQTGGAGVVDEDLERAELELDRFDRSIDLRAVGDIKLEREPTADAVDCPLCGAQRDVQDRDLGSVGSEAAADRLTDAGAATGDGGDLPVNAHAIHGDDPCTTI